MNIKKVLLLLLSLVMIIGIAGCSDSNDTSTGGSAAIVNGEEISTADFEMALSSTIAYYEQQGMVFEGEEAEIMMEQLENDILDYLIGQELINQEIAKTDIEVSEDEINENMDLIKGQFESEDQYNQALTDSQITEDKLREDITNELKMAQFVTSRVGEISVTEEELQEEYDFYNEQMEDFPSFEEVQFQLEQEIISQRTEQHMASLIEDLKVESDIEILYN